MPRTTVRKHRRRNSSGKTTVKRHPRSVKSKKKVSNERFMASEQRAKLHYNPDLARHAVDLVESSDNAYHPMTYYMSALGYDGIFHKQEMGGYSDYGNVIFPHKIKEIYPDIELKETT